MHALRAIRCSQGANASGLSSVPQVAQRGDEDLLDDVVDAAVVGHGAAHECGDPRLGSGETAPRMHGCCRLGRQCASCASRRVRARKIFHQRLHDRPLANPQCSEGRRAGPVPPETGPAARMLPATRGSGQPEPRFFARVRGPMSAGLRWTTARCSWAVVAVTLAAPWPLAGCGDDDGNATTTTRTPSARTLLEPGRSRGAERAADGVRRRRPRTATCPGGSRCAPSASGRPRRRRHDTPTRSSATSRASGRRPTGQASRT